MSYIVKNNFFTIHIQRMIPLYLASNFWTYNSRAFLSNIKKGKFVINEEYIEKVIENFKELAEESSKGESPKYKPELISQRHKLLLSSTKKSNYKPIIPSVPVKKEKHKYPDNSLQITKNRSISQVTKNRSISQITKNRSISHQNPSIKTTQIKMNLADKEIEDLLKQNDCVKAYQVFIEQLAKGDIPKFSGLIKLASWACKEGFIPEIIQLQVVAKKHFPEEFENKLFFEHYLCEATFRGQDHMKALNLLQEMVKNWPKKLKKAKDTATYIMRLIPETSEECQEKAVELVKIFINHDIYTPAFMLWQSLFKSDMFHHQTVAQRLLDDHPELLNGEETRLSKLIEKALDDQNNDLLHRLIYVFITCDLKEPLSSAVSSLLSLYCLSENLVSANEIIKFAQESGLRVSPNSFRQFLHLLNEEKKPSSLAILAFKYGFGGPTAETRESSETPTFKFKF